MKNKFLNFWCIHLYPFCNVKKVTQDFKIDGKEFEKINISANEHIVSQNVRKENLSVLKERGGIKKYLFNWIAIFILSIVFVTEIINPQTFIERALTLPTLSIPFGAILILLVFAITLDKKQAEKFKSETEN